MWTKTTEYSDKANRLKVLKFPKTSAKFLVLLPKSEIKNAAPKGMITKNGNMFIVGPMSKD